MSVYVFILPLGAAVALAAIATRNARQFPDGLTGAALVLALATLAGMRFLLPAERMAVWWPLAGLTLVALAGIISGSGPATRDGIARLLLLFLAGAAAVVAAAPALVVTTWTLLALALWLARPAGPETAVGKPGWLWAGALLVWLAIASLPVLSVAGEQGPSSLVPALVEVEAFPALTQSLLLLAALVMIGPFPLHLWRPPAPSRGAATSVLVQTAPSAAGALLLARLADAGDVVTGYALPLTLLGLLGLFWAAFRAWQEREDAMSLAFSILMAEASLLVLVGTWADGSAVLAGARVLILGAGALGLAAGRETEAWQRAALLPAIAALAAFPLTAGFTAQGALYSTWVEGGRWLLVVVTVLLSVPLLAALFSWLWPAGWPAGRPELRSLWPLLPALGLVSWAGFGGLSFLAVVAVAVQIGGAYLLFRYRERTVEIQQLLEEALLPRESVARVLPAAGETVRALRSAVREAALMLEGEGALLWVLLFFVVAWLAR